MNDCIYAKYNRHRAPRFRIETSIIQTGDGKKLAVKRALMPEAELHIQDMAKSYPMIGSVITGARLKLPGGFRHDATSLTVDFVEGVSLDRLLLNAVLERDLSGFRKIIDDYNTLLKTELKTVNHPVITERMKEVFGISDPSELEGHAPYFALTTIDPIFENILISNENRYMIDNEWVFEGSLPVSFVLFRSLFYFYKIKYVDFGVESFVPFDEELERLGFVPDIAKLYQRMDDSFQAHVFGDEWRSSHKQRYARQRFSVQLLEQDLERHRELLREKHEQIMSFSGIIKERDRMIKERDKLVKERDQLIADMKNTRGWRFIRRIERSVNCIFPPGTRRGRIASRLGLT